MSQYFYCPACADVARTALSSIDLSQPSRGIGSYGSAIVVGFIGGLWGGESAFDVERALEDAAERFCHPAFVVVIDDALGPVCFAIANGKIERRDVWTRAELKEM